MTMTVKELRIALEVLQGILSASNARAQSKDISKFLELFAGRDDQAVEEFLADLKTRLQESEKPAKPAPPPADQLIVQRYSARLQEADIDRAAFDLIFNELDKDKAVRKIEMEQIAFRYIGGRKTWPYRKTALTSIRDTFERRAYQAVKMKQVEKAHIA